MWSLPFRGLCPYFWRPLHTRFKASGTKQGPGLTQGGLGSPGWGLGCSLGVRGFDPWAYVKSRRSSELKKRQDFLLLLKLLRAEMDEERGPHARRRAESERCLVSRVDQDWPPKDNGYLVPFRGENNIARGCPQYTMVIPCKGPVDQAPCRYRALFGR